MSVTQLIANSGAQGLVLLLICLEYLSYPASVLDWNSEMDCFSLISAGITQLALIVS